MAKRRRKISMSQAIRDYLAKHPSAMPKDIQAALAAKGVNVGYSLISQIKYKAGRRGGHKTRSSNSRKLGRPSTAVSFELLVAAKEIADQMGGIERAKEALAMLERLR
jgi:hypothetical protein